MPATPPLTQAANRELWNCGDGRLLDDGMPSARLRVLGERGREQGAWLGSSKTLIVFGCTKPTPTQVPMLIKTLLNHCQKFESFVYDRVAFEGERLTVDIMPRKGSRPRCVTCGKRGPTYDTAKVPRFFQFVPLWGIAVYFVYCMRRVDCRRCGVTTERVPLGRRKEPNLQRLSPFSGPLGSSYELGGGG